MHQELLSMREARAVVFWKSCNCLDDRKQSMSWETTSPCKTVTWQHFLTEWTGTTTCQETKRQLKLLRTLMQLSSRWIESRFSVVKLSSFACCSVRVRDLSTLLLHYWVDDACISQSCALLPFRCVTLFTLYLDAQVHICYIGVHALAIFLSSLLLLCVGILCNDWWSKSERTCPSHSNQQRSNETNENGSDSCCLVNVSFEQTVE